MTSTTLPCHFTKKAANTSHTEGELGIQGFLVVRLTIVYHHFTTKFQVNTLSAPPMTGYRRISTIVLNITSQRRDELKGKRKGFKLQKSKNNELKMTQRRHKSANTALKWTPETGIQRKATCSFAHPKMQPLRHNLHCVIREVQSHQPLKLQFHTSHAVLVEPRSRSRDVLIY